MAQEIEFPVDGGRLKGLFYEPATGQAPYPTVVMANGFRAPKEMGCTTWAQRFAEAGLAVLVFDNRSSVYHDTFAAYDVDPVTETRDFRWAIDYALALDAVDPDRLGIWGTSMTGGYVLQIAAVDRRVRCVVSQVPMLSGWMNISRFGDADGYRDMVEAERQRLVRGEDPTAIRMTSPDRSVPSAFPSMSANRYFHDQRDQQSPRLDWWENKVSIRSIDWYMEHDVNVWLPRISPTPLLMIVADHDDGCPTAESLKAYEQALEPKRLVLIRGDHYTPYVEDVATANGAARDFLVEHLMASAVATGDQ
ncbi:alpha/beta hydrolase [Conexibacter woesei]|uniref:Peptidase S15 n=1 Tax=Conexibacter woesei (strain DSM 14684 / CCUG 47730 / CIP 108061 / JCM 11494 / NBRC 100937 / ID131577) TaxID=469383 RepID=D3F492_CONWI|nr:alpha/beta hydrolase [Conexibacter woesei]ADB50464.1 peptidase S15 [Conexibacter woesei DSM 14684]